MPNFLGYLQPMEPLGPLQVSSRRPTEYRPCPRICGRGVCTDFDDAKKQLKELYCREHPAFGSLLDDEKKCMGGLFVFSGPIYTIIDNAADEESERLINQMYDESIEIAPFE